MWGRGPKFRNRGGGRQEVGGVENRQQRQGFHPRPLQHRRRIAGIGPLRHHLEGHTDSTLATQAGGT